MDSLKGYIVVIMKVDEISILEQYRIKVTRLTIFCCIFGIIIGFAISTTCKFCGYMKNISIQMMIMIDLFIAVPEVFILMKKSKEVITRGRLNQQVFSQVKNIMLIIIFVNYYIFNLIQASKELWYLAFFLAMIEALFLDVKYTIVVNTGLTISIIIICILQPAEMPDKTMFLQEIFIRGAMSILIMMLIAIMVYCAGKILLSLKEEHERFIIDYLEKVEENQRQVREVKHNLNNQIIVLQSIIDKNDIKEANIFINKLINNTKSLNVGIYTENIAINSVLNYKVNDSKKYNINWNIEVQASNNIQIEHGDLGIIIGNLIDNAIEACSLLENEKKRYIDFYVYSKNSNIHIYIKNSKNNYLIKGETWKKDRKRHGIGLKSVKKILDKYNGFMSNKDIGDDYEVDIMLWNIC